MENENQKNIGLDLVKIQSEIAIIEEELLQLPQEVQTSKYWRAVHYFLLQAQGSLASLVIQRSRSRSKKL